MEHPLKVGVNYCMAVKGASNAEFNIIVTFTKLVYTIAIGGL